MINTILYSFIQMIFFNVNGMYKDVVLVFPSFIFFLYLTLHQTPFIE